ncbi:NrsF family protein [Aureimonas leprariae]|uniref:DUF1109 family protein n=1 Tax=Plantimonas leprariae TaxID=2615207 RepID=A0A7V7TV95_9HYPH|nr:DUF1109 domain-containing protein [Aureimonas leprariae]KAB0677767.1 DUF1109 family protein [Aureimonas leprariae]
MPTAATNDLIEGLVTDLTPARRSAVFGRLSLGAGAGALVAIAATALWLGPRPDLAVAAALPSFWIKAAYTLVAAVAGLLAVERLSRPGGRAAAGTRLAALAFLAVVVLAAGQMAAGMEDGRPMFLGRSAEYCPFAIFALALPVLAGTVWAMRGLGPTRPVAAGLGAGLFAGAVASFVYSFSCAERSIPFLASWYTLGIVLAGLAGLAAGRAGLLRW